jgi:hypothetical protein
MTGFGTGVGGFGTGVGGFGTGVGGFGAGGLGVGVGGLGAGVLEPVHVFVAEFHAKLSGQFVFTIPL